MPDHADPGHRGRLGVAGPWMGGSRGDGRPGATASEGTGRCRQRHYSDSSIGQPSVYSGWLRPSLASEGRMGLGLGRGSTDPGFGSTTSRGGPVEFMLGSASSGGTVHGSGSAQSGLGFKTIRAGVGSCRPAFVGFGLSFPAMSGVRSARIAFASTPDTERHLVGQGTATALDHVCVGIDPEHSMTLGFEWICFSTK